MATLAGVARRLPQTAYTGLQKSLYQEWDFVQRVSPDIGVDFQVVEDELQDILLPALLKGATSEILGRAITVLLVKQAGITLPKPTKTAGANWTASCVIMGHLAALRGTTEFWSGNHDLLMEEGMEEIQ